MSINVFGVFEIRTIKDKEKEQNEINKMKDDIKDLQDRVTELENFASKYKIKSHRFEKDIKNLLEQESLTIEELDQILEPLKNKIMAITDYEDAIDFILDHIDKKNPNMNIQKPTYHGPVIDEEVKETRGTQKRYDELKALGIWKSIDQLGYLFSMEWKLNIPMFEGTTYQEVSDYMTKYKKQFNDWKTANKVSYITTKQFENNSNKGVAYCYGM